MPKFFLILKHVNNFSIACYKSNNRQNLTSHERDKVKKAVEGCVSDQYSLNPDPAESSSYVSLDLECAGVHCCLIFVIVKGVWQVKKGYVRLGPWLRDHP